MKNSVLTVLAVALALSTACEHQPTPAESEMATLALDKFQISLAVESLARFADSGKVLKLDRESCTSTGKTVNCEQFREALSPLSRNLDCASASSTSFRAVIGEVSCDVYSEKERQRVTAAWLGTFDPPQQGEGKYTVEPFPADTWIYDSVAR